MPGDRYVIDDVTGELYVSVKQVVEFAERTYDLVLAEDRSFEEARLAASFGEHYRHVLREYTGEVFTPEGMSRVWHVHADEAASPLVYSVTLDPPDCTCVTFALNNNRLSAEGKKRDYECKHIKKVRDQNQRVI